MNLLGLVPLFVGLVLIYAAWNGTNAELFAEIFGPGVVGPGPGSQSSGSTPGGGWGWMPPIGGNNGIAGSVNAAGQSI